MIDSSENDWTRLFLDILSSATGMHLTFYDSSGMITHRVGERHICETTGLPGRTPTPSDRDAYLCKEYLVNQVGRIRLYKCSTGINSAHVTTAETIQDSPKLVIDGFRLQDEGEESYREIAAGLGLDPTEFNDLIAKTPVMPVHRIVSITAGLSSLILLPLMRAKSDKRLDTVEADLKQAEAVLESILNAIPDVIGLQDLDHRIIRYNEAGYRLVGKGPAETHGRRCFELIGEKSTCDDCATSEVYRTGEPAVIERFESEMNKWLEVNAYPVKDTEGRLISVIEHIRDITDYKDNLEKVRVSEAKFKALFDDSPLGVVHFDGDGIVTVANSAFERILGTDRGELAGFDILNKVTHREMLQAVEKCLEGEDSRYTGEYTTVLSGSRSYLDILFRPLFDASDNVMGGMGVIEDISARIEAEQKLEKLEQRHRFLLEGQRDVVFTADVDGMVTYCSPNALSFAGYEVDDIIGRNVTEFFVDGETLLPGLMKLVVEATARDESVTFEVEYISASGRHFPVEVIAKGILIDGRLQEIHGVKRDISDRKQAEEERKRLEEQVFHSQKLDSLGVLAGGIAHDFNNLLVGILGNADLALNSLPQEAAERSELEAIEVAARRASELCDNMLAYSGKGSFIKKLVTLNDIVEEVSGMIKASIPKKITLSFNLDPDLPLVEADVSQMRQIVMNLMINGAEAIGDRVGMVAVTTGTKYCDSRSLSRSYMLEELEEGEYCYLSVRDSGSGMDEELI